MTETHYPIQWGLATFARHAPDEQGANVSIDIVRRMTDGEVGRVTDALNLMGYVSAHALTEPLRQTAQGLVDFIGSVIEGWPQTSILQTHTAATIAFDNFLNQIPLTRLRMLRNLGLFAGPGERDQVCASIQEGFELAGAYRVLYEVRNSCQHAMLPTDVVELASVRRPDGTFTTRWTLLVDKWRSLHTGWPAALTALPSTLALRELMDDLITFFDDRLGECFLVCSEKMDEAANLVLDLVGEAMQCASGDHESIGVAIIKYGGASPGGLLSQTPLNLEQCGEVLLNVEQARQQAGLPKLHPQRPVRWPG